MPATPISSALAPLVVAGGSLATGRELARQAGAAGREVRLVDEPADGRALCAALDGAAAVILIPARTVGSLAAQVQAILDAIGEPATGPHLVLVTGFSLGHGLQHALNTPSGSPTAVAPRRSFGAAACPTPSCVPPGSPATRPAATPSRSPRTRTPTG